MLNNDIHIECHRAIRPKEALVLLGPGGVGKSTLGRELAGQLRWPLIDLDLIFCAAIGTIGEVISNKGYDYYRAENLALAERCVADIAEPTIVVTSSGFLAHRQAPMTSAAPSAWLSAVMALRCCHRSTSTGRQKSLLHAS